MSEQNISYESIRSDLKRIRDNNVVGSVNSVYSVFASALLLIIALLVDARK